MKIPYKSASEYMPEIVTGALRRVGAILVDKASGKVFGHLKEAGGLSEILSGFSGNPITGGEAVLSQLVQNVQISHVMSALKSLQLVTSVGSVASVAGLGVSIAGFAILAKKLDRIYAKLDDIARNIEKIKKSVEELGIKWEAISYAKLQSAKDLLDKAENSSSIQNRTTELRESSRTFNELRNYYYKLMCDTDPWNSGELPVEAAVELYSRFIFCCLGELHADFLLGDYGRLEISYSKIMNQVREASSIDKVQAYRTRAKHASDILAMSKFSDIANHVANATKCVKETFDRIETMKYEFEYIKNRGIEPIEYFEQLKAMPTDIVLIPAVNG